MMPFVKWLYNTTTVTQKTFSLTLIISIPKRGTHETGFKSALTRVVNDYAKQSGALKESDSGLSGDDIREGLVAVVSVKLTDPQFERTNKD